jgi:hypothetical protein
VIYPYNPDILAEVVFDCQRVPAVNGGDCARRAEDTADCRASTSTATSCLNDYIPERLLYLKREEGTGVGSCNVCRFPGETQGA